jgi:hypothetical protein
MSNYPQSFPVTKLYRKQSKEGRSYFVGRLGGARLALLKSNETGDNGEEVWTLLISPAPQKTGAPAQPEQPPQQERRDWQRPAEDTIPF